MSAAIQMSNRNVGVKKYIGINQNLDLTFLIDSFLQISPAYFTPFRHSSLFLQTGRHRSRGNRRYGFGISPNITASIYNSLRGILVASVCGAAVCYFVLLICVAFSML